MLQIQFGGRWGTKRRGEPKFNHKEYAQLLQKHIPPPRERLRALRVECVVIEDNVPVHTSGGMKEVREALSYKNLSHSGNSPELNRTKRSGGA